MGQKKATTVDQGQSSTDQAPWCQDCALAQDSSLGRDGKGKEKGKRKRQPRRKKVEEPNPEETKPGELPALDQADASPQESIETMALGPIDDESLLGDPSELQDEQEAEPLGAPTVTPRVKRARQHLTPSPE